MCGATQKLEHHHKDPRVKAFEILMCRKRTDDPLLLEELNKCELLCKDCHVLAHKPAHGTISRYVSGCRCVECKEASRITRRNYRHDSHPNLTVRIGCD